MQLSLKRNAELGDEIKRMHESHQSRITERTSDTLLEEQLAHLEAEKEHLHQVLKAPFFNTVMSSIKNLTP